MLQYKQKEGKKAKKEDETAPISTQTPDHSQEQERINSEIRQAEEEHKKKMAAISNKIDQVISANSEEFVINFRQIEGE